MRKLLLLLLAVSLPVTAFAAAALAPVVPATVRTQLPLTETAKINALINSMQSMPGAVFIRNGSEYGGAQAAAHLRMKWKSAGRHVKTAEDFIRYCASQSSMTGRNYSIRFADGHTVDSGPYFEALLHRMEAPARITTSAPQESIRH